MRELFFKLTLKQQREVSEAWRKRGHDNGCMVMQPIAPKPGGQITSAVGMMFTEREAGLIRATLQGIKKQREKEAKQ